MAFDPDKITYFASTDARGKHVRFGIKAKDRQRHMYVIGKTGMGKSTLLENMAVQDIQNGEGMAFIDPHGSAAETLLNYIPEHRVNDVLYFAPFDTEHPVSFNIMEDVGPEKRHLVVSGLMSVFKKIWVDAWSARMEYILSNTLLALLEYPDSTLLGVNRMLSDKAYRDLVVANVKDPGVRAFWVDEFAKYNERYMQEAGDAIKNKIGQFTSNPIIRNIIGQPHSSFDIRTMMDEKKILIMNLSKGLIGESNANLLGSMLTTRIYLAAMSRADLPPEKMREMPNFYFYVDEFQSFANATFANILSEARKYHLNLTIAHQYIEQMEEEVRNAVFGNVGTIIAFRVGPFDAETLEPIFAPQFTATDVVNLSFAQIYLTLMIDGIGSQPFSAITLPPIAPPATSCKDMAIGASRAHFSSNRALVEEGILAFHQPVTVPKREKESTTLSRKEEQGIQRSSTDTKYERRTLEERVEKKSNNNSERTHFSEKNSGQSSIRVNADDAKKQSHIHSSVPSKKNHSKSETAEDLRAILKRIATRDVNQPVESEEKQNGGTNRSPSTPLREKQNDLREALASLKGTPIQEEKRESENVLQEAHLPPSKKIEQTSPNTSTSQQTISPKELERMMRVTTDDKPPV